MTALTSLRVVEGEARRFGEFDLIAKLGRGGMAEAFLAARRDRPADVVVVKRLTPDFADDQEHRDMFEEEMRIMPLFNHPNVVRTLEVGEQADQKFLAMEFLDGLPLDQCADAVRALGERAAIHVVCELLDGLHYVHELRGAQGEPLMMVHRDVSPHNVFVTYEGRVTLVDFGIAKSVGRAKHTSTGVVRGKLAYMAPEQALCDEVDRRTDIFAAGIILWELLSGKRYWEGLSDVQILKRMTFGDMPGAGDLTEVRADVRAVLARALAVKPDDRYATARAFRDELVPLLDGPVRRTELGSAVSAVAGGYREALRAVLDSHLVAARGTDGLRGIDPTLDAVPSKRDGAAPPSGLGSPSSTQPAESDSAGGASLPSDSHPDGREFGSPSPAVAELAPASEAVEPVERAFTETGGASSLEVPLGPRPRPRRSPVVWIALMLGAAAIGVVGTRAMRSDPPVDAAALAPQATPLVQLELEVHPRDATVYFDGLRVTDMPFVAKLPRDGVGHSLRVEAPGYVPHSRFVVLDKDVTLEISLEVEPAASSRTAALTPSAVGSASASSPGERPTGPMSAKPAAGSQSSPVRQNPPSSATSTGKPVVDTTPPWGKKPSPGRLP